MGRPCKKCGAIDRGKDRACIPCKKVYSANRHKANPEKAANRRKQHAIKNPTYMRNYMSNRYKTDTNFRLACNLRRRLKHAIEGNYKVGSAVRDLGCSIENLKCHLENQFQPGMSWENQGQWHIDHIVPLSKFDLTNKEQLLKACHYTNLQPLWAKDNIAKGNR